MKIVDNSAIAASKKQYIQPEVKVENILLSTTILVGSINNMTISTESSSDQW